MSSCPLRIHPLANLCALSLAALLVACGGGGDAAGGAATTLTFTSANPAVHNTTIDLGLAKGGGNDARAADAFSASAYCDVYFEDAVAANGRHYALQVYFRQSDKAALHASVVENNLAGGAAPWVAFHNNSGNPITGITVDTTARTVAFTNKALSNAGSGEAVTVNGVLGFIKSAAAACGA